uniref:Uncharacterized protein n=1 Tax=viral metagenome TaxID=1070528 RepID=A0A6C0BJM5_9ZZZZ
MDSLLSHTTPGTTPGVYSKDFDWTEFVSHLFAMPPQEPFTFTIELSSPQLLGAMLIQGVREKYRKEAAQLTASEIAEVQQYYHSIGFHVIYQITPETHQSNIGGDPIMVNVYQIDFQPYSRLYDPHNHPGHF